MSPSQTLDLLEEIGASLEERTLLTVAKLAERWRRAPKTIYNWISANRCPIRFLRTRKGHIYFQLSEVRWAEARGAIRRIGPQS